jgi:2,3-bisphosphoglycerate-dependent phosphoglycerate mutase
MVRAVTTASYVAEALDMPQVAWPEVHEVGGIYDSVGEGENEKKIGQPGNNRAFFTANFPNLLLPEWLGDEGWWNRPAETRKETLARAREFWNVLLERHGGTEDRVALITHGGFFQRLMTTLVNPFSVEAPQLPSEKAAVTRTPSAMPPPAVIPSLEDSPLPSHGIRRVWFDSQNTAITRIDFFDAEAVTVYLNRVDHLPIELIT